MATAYLMVGFAGAGKTTAAKKLALECGALRLTPDEWMAEIFPEPLSHEDFDRYFGRMCRLVWVVASQCLRNGQDVILDIGFWSRDSRDHARKTVSDLGASCKVIFVDCDEKIFSERLLRRLSSLWSSPGAIRDRFAAFERPQADESFTMINGDS